MVILMARDIRCAGRFLTIEYDSAGRTSRGGVCCSVVYYCICSVFCEVLPVAYCCTLIVYSLVQNC